MGKPLRVVMRQGDPWFVGNDVAAFFGKEHRNVLRDSRNLLKNLTGSNLSWFTEATYRDEKGEERPCIEMTRDGLALLAMGFTGEQAGGPGEPFAKVETPADATGPVTDDQERAGTLADAHGRCPFIFMGKPLRVVMRAGDPWFVAADVCRILDLQNASDAMEKLDADEKATVSPSTLGIIQGGPDRLIVSEGGYYTLVMRAREATQPGSVAHRFRRWVTSNVLPSIRKNGGYIAGQEKLVTGEMTPAELLAHAFDVLRRKADAAEQAPGRLVGTGTALVSGAGQGGRGPFQEILN